MFSEGEQFPLNNYHHHIYDNSQLIVDSPTKSAINTLVVYFHHFISKIPSLERKFPDYHGPCLHMYVRSTPLHDLRHSTCTYITAEFIAGKPSALGTRPLSRPVWDTRCRSRLSSRGCWRNTRRRWDSCVLWTCRAWWLHSCRGTDLSDDTGHRSAACVARRQTPQTRVYGQGRKRATNITLEMCTRFIQLCANNKLIDWLICVSQGSPFSSMASFMI